MGVEEYMQQKAKRQLLKRGRAITLEELNHIISQKPRIEKVAIKDIKLRTFITQDDGRDNLVGHVYDISYNTLNKGKDNLVVIDDSIVRGTTLKYSIIEYLTGFLQKRL